MFGQIICLVVTAFLSADPMRSITTDFESDEGRPAVVALGLRNGVFCKGYEQHLKRCAVAADSMGVMH